MNRATKKEIDNLRRLHVRGLGQCLASPRCRIAIMPTRQHANISVVSFRITPHLLLMLVFVVLEAGLNAFGAKAEA